MGCPDGNVVGDVVGDVTGVGTGFFAAVRASSTLRELAWAAFLSSAWVVADFCTGVAAVLGAASLAPDDEALDDPNEPKEVLLGDAEVVDDFEDDEVLEDDELLDDDEELEDVVLLDENPCESEEGGLP